MAEFIAFKTNYVYAYGFTSLCKLTEKSTEPREMERSRKSASLITQNVLIISIEKSFILALIRSLEKLQRKTARHAKKAGFYMAVA